MYRVAFLAAFASACTVAAPDASTSPALEALPPVCTPHAEYTYASSTVPGVFLLAGGFSDDGCRYEGVVVLEHARGYRWGYDGVRLAFQRDGRVSACEFGRLCPFDVTRVTPVCGESVPALDARGDVMPVGGCGIR